MQTSRRAVIDVGTNSVKLLIAEVTSTLVQPLHEESRQTRLGQSFYQTHRLQHGAIGKTAEAVAAFADTARAARVDSIRVIATSAARDATNAADLTSAIRETSGLSVEIISGQQEADWAFRGVASDPALEHEQFLLLDAGGGSTEFILGRGKERYFCESFPLGTVRLMERFPHSDPPKEEELSACRQWLDSFVSEKVRPKLEPALRAVSSEIEFVGTGGTASILGCMEARLTVFDRDRLEATRLTREQLAWHVDHLWSLPIEQRKQIVGLPPNRADVILTGAAIYEAVLREFGFAELRISTRGLRFAAVMDPA